MQITYTSTFNFEHALTLAQRLEDVRSRGGEATLSSADLELCARALLHAVTTFDNLSLLAEPLSRAA